MTRPNPDAPTPPDPEEPQNPVVDEAPAAADVADEPEDAPIADVAPDRTRDADADAPTGEVDEVAEAQDPLAAAQRERDEYLDALRRKQADFENFRKRMMREGASQRIAGHAEVAERMLDVLDDFDRTLEAAGVDAQSQDPNVDPGFLKGVQLVHGKLARVLADFGLTRIDDAGEVFDPNRHEAVQQQSAARDLDEPVVAQVLRPGYELGGRVLRAAMVVVEQ